MADLAAVESFAMRLGALCRASRARVALVVVGRAAAGRLEGSVPAEALS